MELPYELEKWLHGKDCPKEEFSLEQGSLDEVKAFFGIKHTEHRSIKEDFDTPYRKYQRAVIYLINSEPFYAHMLRDCIIEWDREGMPPTMGVAFIGNTFHLMISSEFVDRISVYQCVAALQHEMMHIIFNHPGRAKNYLKYPYNIAADLAINQMLKTDYNLQNLDILLHDGHDFKWPGNLSAEDYYDKLVATKKLHVPCPSCDGERLVNTDHKPLGAGFVMKLKDQYYHKCPACNGVGSNRKANDGSHDRFYAPSGKELCQILKYDPHVAWGKGDGSGNKDEQEESGEAQENKMRQMVAKAYEASKGQKDLLRPGTLPGWAEEYIRELVEGTIPWQQVLRAFIHRASISLIKQTRNRPNRRYGILYPGTVSDFKLKMVVITDTSGSMSNTDISACLDEIDRIVSDKHEVYVLEHDTTAHKFYKYKDRPKAVNGRGGTAFQPAFDYIRENKIKPDCVLFFTDGDSCDTPSKPPYPVLWVYTPQHNRKVEWGQHVVLKYDDGLGH